MLLTLPLLLVLTTLLSPIASTNSSDTPANGTYAEDFTVELVNTTSNDTVLYRPIFESRKSALQNKIHHLQDLAENAKEHFETTEHSAEKGEIFKELFEQVKKFLDFFKYHVEKAETQQDLDAVDRETIQIFDMHYKSLSEYVRFTISDYGNGTYYGNSTGNDTDILRPTFEIRLATLQNKIRHLKDLAFNAKEHFETSEHSEEKGEVFKELFEELKKFLDIFKYHIEKAENQQDLDVIDRETIQLFEKHYKSLSEYIRFTISDNGNVTYQYGNGNATDVFQSPLDVRKASLLIKIHQLQEFAQTVKINFESTEHSAEKGQAFQELFEEIKQFTNQTKNTIEQAEDHQVLDLVEGGAFPWFKSHYEALTSYVIIDIITTPGNGTYQNDTTSGNDTGILFESRRTDLINRIKNLHDFAENVKENFENTEHSAEMGEAFSSTLEYVKNFIEVFQYHIEQAENHQDLDFIENESMQLFEEHYKSLSEYANFTTDGNATNNGTSQNDLEYFWEEFNKFKSVLRNSVSELNERLYQNEEFQEFRKRLSEFLHDITQAVSEASYKGQDELDKIKETLEEKFNYYFNAIEEFKLIVESQADVAEQTAQIIANATRMNSEWIRAMRVLLVETISEECRRNPYQKLDEASAENNRIIINNEQYNKEHVDSKIESLEDFKAHLEKKAEEFKQYLLQATCDVTYSLETQIKLAKTEAKLAFKKDINDLITLVNDKLEGECRFTPLTQVKDLSGLFPDIKFNEIESNEAMQDLRDIIAVKVNDLKREIEENDCVKTVFIANEAITQVAEINIDEVSQIVYVDSSEGDALLNHFSEFAANQSIMIAEKMSQLNLPEEQLQGRREYIAKQLELLQEVLGDAKTLFGKLNSVLTAIVEDTNLDGKRNFYYEQLDSVTTNCQNATESLFHQTLCAEKADNGKKQIRLASSEEGIINGYNRGISSVCELAFAKGFVEKLPLICTSYAFEIEAAAQANAILKSQIETYVNLLEVVRTECVQGTDSQIHATRCGEEAKTGHARINRADNLEAVTKAYEYGVKKICEYAKEEQFAQKVTSCVSFVEEYAVVIEAKEAGLLIIDAYETECKSSTDRDDYVLKCELMAIGASKLIARSRTAEEVVSGQEEGIKVICGFAASASIAMPSCSEEDYTVVIIARELLTPSGFPITMAPSPRSD